MSGCLIPNDSTILIVLLGLKTDNSACVEKITLLPPPKHGRLFGDHGKIIAASLTATTLMLTGTS
jgi:hypothetical protein